MSRRDEILALAPYATKTEISQVVGVTYERVRQVLRDAENPSRSYDCTCETCGKRFQRASYSAGRFCSAACVRLACHNPEFIETARSLWNDKGLSMAAVAQQLGVTKSVIAGIRWRNPGFNQRPSPLKRRA